MKMKGFSAFILIASMVLLVGTVHANLLVNGSFEFGRYDDSAHPGYTRLPPGSADITGWVAGGDGLDWHVGTGSSAHFGPSKDGDYVVDLSLDYSPAGTIAQTFTTTLGTDYRVSFYLGAPLFDNAVAVSVAGEYQVFSAIGGNYANIPWVLETLDFAGTGGDVTLLFASLGGGFWGPVLDGVSVDALAAPVPEPSTMILLGFGLVGLAGFSRKKIYK
jgi:hypothetical protein